jgi:AcrR family transcriptional regulator
MLYNRCFITFDAISLWKWNDKMPVVVDSDERRTAVVSAAAELIVEGGLNAVTFRNIAARLGFSTTVISHYFRDKTDVLRATYQHVVAEAVMHREQVLAGQNASPVRVLEEVLPVADTQRRIWTVWLCFWTAALFDKTLLEEHRRGLAGTRERLRRHFLAEGELAERAEQAAEDLAQAIFGIAVQALFDPAYWSPERQRAAYRRAAVRIAALPQTAS